MAKLATNIESFEVIAVEDMFERGTVEVTLNGKTKRVKASRWIETHEDRRADWKIYAYGMSGRYLTGKKAWPACITTTKWSNGNITEDISFGRDERAGRCLKTSNLFFVE